MLKNWLTPAKTSTQKVVRIHARNADKTPPPESVLRELDATGGGRCNTYCCREWSGRLCLAHKRPLRGLQQDGGYVSTMHNNAEWQQQMGRRHIHGDWSPSTLALNASVGISSSLLASSCKIRRCSASITCTSSSSLNACFFSGPSIDVGVLWTSSTPGSWPADSNVCIVILRAAVTAGAMIRQVQRPIDEAPGLI